jgi:hypothetical protein
MREMGCIGAAIRNIGLEMRHEGLGGRAGPTLPVEDLGA